MDIENVSCNKGLGYVSYIMKNVRYELPNKTDMLTSWSEESTVVI